MFAGAALKTESLGSGSTADVQIHHCNKSILSSTYDGFFFNLYVKSKTAFYWIMVIQFKNLLFWLLGGHQMFESCLAHTCSDNPPPPQTHSCRELRLPTRPLHWDVPVFASLDHCCQQEWATLSRCGGRHYRLQFPNSHQDSHWKINECLRSLLAACLAIKGLDQWTRDDFKGHWD